MSEPFSRRHFVKQSVLAAGTAAAATAAAVSLVPRRVLGGPRNVPPSEKMNIAGIGIGGMGKNNLRSLETENIVALCDVDPSYAAKTIARYPQAKVYVDFREMLEKQKDVDGVLVATPDHTHAVISMAAMRAGKHVYCQKPLCHDVYEARMLAQAAKECKVVTQMGIQGHSGSGHAMICQWVAAGLIGEVREVDAWCDLTYYPWGHAGWSSAWSQRPKETPPVPADLHWDLWIGPAAMRPYHRAYHPLTWRQWWDFGNGMMGDRGAHTFDPIVSALKLTAPTSIDATTCGNTAEVHPLSAIVTFQFPARGNLPPVKLTWYEGTRPPRPEELEDGRRFPAEGGLLIKGSKATIMAGVYGDSPRIIPEAKMKEVAPLVKSLSPAERRADLHRGGHEQNWVHACKNETAAVADFAYSAPLTEICLLGNIAQRVDSRILWDAEKLQVTNLPDANKYVRTEYRKGWTL